jgi:hypothetical protein
MNVLRDISVILLAAEAFIFALIPLALFGALVYGVWWLRRHSNLPTWLRDIRGYVMLGLSYVERAMDAAVKPVIAVHTAFATLGGWLDALQKREP